MLNRIAKYIAWFPLLITLPVAASAQNVNAGRNIAERWCSACHVVDFRQRTAPNDAIPSFPAIANMKSTTMISLAAFLSTSHEPMPNFALSRGEIADVSAYILSLRKAHERANQ
jgi:cytochrome c